MALSRIGRCWWSLLHQPVNGLFLGGLQPGWTENCVGAKRHLLSEDIIRLGDFKQNKSVAHHITGSEGNYFEQINKKLQNNELLLKDELKRLLHLCQCPEDMVTARDAIYRYHAENRNMAYGEFKFGPIFMRLCYALGQEDMAITSLTDKRMKGFFNDKTSFNIALDMLFTKRNYEKALEVLGLMKDYGILFNKYTHILAAATCYKLNSPESFRLCITLIEEEQSKGNFTPRHAYYFAVALSLRQNDINKAQSMYSRIMVADSRICQNLKVLIQVMSGTVMEAGSTLSAAIQPKSPFFVKKLEFSQEVVDLLRLQTKDGPHAMKVEQIVSQLEQAGQVTQQTLDDMLCQAPRRQRQPVPAMMERTSRRTLQPQPSSLLLE